MGAEGEPSEGEAGGRKRGEDSGFLFAKGAGAKEHEEQEEKERNEGFMAYVRGGRLAEFDAGEEGHFSFEPYLECGESFCFLPEIYRPVADDGVFRERHAFSSGYEVYAGTGAWMRDEEGLYDRGQRTWGGEVPLCPTWLSGAYYDAIRGDAYGVGGDGVVRGAFAGEVFYQGPGVVYGGEEWAGKPYLGGCKERGERGDGAPGYDMFYDGEPRHPLMIQKTGR